MKIAKEIAEAVASHVADRDGHAFAFELENIVADKLRPIRDALEMVWSNPESMTPSDMMAQYVDACEMLDEEG